MSDMLCEGVSTSDTLRKGVDMGVGMPDTFHEGISTPHTFHKGADIGVSMPDMQGEPDRQR